MSSPNLYGTLGSLAVPSHGDASHLHVQQEHVQPSARDEKSRSTTYIQPQSRLVSSMQEQMERYENITPDFIYMNQDVTLMTQRLMLLAGIKCYF